MLQGKWWLIVLFLLLALLVRAQRYRNELYPTDSSNIYYFHNRLDVESPLRLIHVDTGLVNFEAYNWLDRDMPFNISLGNSGLAYHNLLYSPRISTDFDYGVHTFDQYLFTAGNIRYFLNRTPFSEVYYVTGASKEQLFNARHQQRVYRNLSLGIDFEHINSLGTYQRQKSNNRRVALKGQYFTENLRYGVIAHYSHSKAEVRENGGIAYDSVYEQNLEPDRSLIAVKLWNAQNRVRRATLGLQQYYQLSPRSSEAADDTITGERPRLRFHAGRLSHTVEYDRNAMVYTDQNPRSGYYPRILIDSIQTQDSVYYHILENRFAWSNADYIDRNRPQPLVLMTGVKHRFIRVADSWTTFRFSHLIPYSELHFNPHPLLSLQADASIILSDDRYQGDFALNSSARISILRSKPYKTNFEAGFGTMLSETPFFFQYYRSNHYQWDNSFDKTFTSTLTFAISQQQWKTGVDLISVNKPIYLGSDTLPAQYSGNVGVFRGYLKNHLHLGRFNVAGYFVYQTTTHEQVISVPDFMGYLSVMFNLGLMGGALNTHSGIDLRYHTPYYAMSYVPALRSFYLQQHTRTGGYFLMDFFVNFQVKRTRFFLKGQNVLSLFNRTFRYYAAPHYPLQDFGIKFGLEWRFYD